MIIGLFHPGSGVGDQLFCYLAARITAERLGVSFTMLGGFKGGPTDEDENAGFMKLYESGTNVVGHKIEYPAGKIVVQNDWPVYEGKSHFDPEFFFIEDNTIVDGCRLQDEKYWKGYPILRWLETKPVEVPKDLCIIGFRGNEYYAVPELGLPKDYFVEAMALMRKENPNMRFRVVTDDPDMARACFPHLEVTHQLDMDWRQVRYARYSIICNSAFYILPRWLAHQDVAFAKTILPRYWARRNIKEWSTSMNYYKQEGMIYI